MIQILRLTHRLNRDKRNSTHCALVSRAFNTKTFYYSGDYDSNFENSISKINSQFGNSFEIKYVKNPIELIKEKRKQKYTIINLTMYGINLPKLVNKIRKLKNILVIIGSEKVPIQYYKLADFNIAISNQPHSEIAALAIFLHEYYSGKQLNKKFKNPKLKILPQKFGKKVDIYK